MDLALSNLKKHYNLTEGRKDIQEDLSTPVEEMLSTLVDQAVKDAGVSPQRMSRQEKINIVQQLSEQGILTMKGAVSEIARQLFVSEPTVYRYLNHK